MSILIKKELRKAMGTTLRALPNDNQTSESHRVVQRVLALPRWQAASVVCTYLPPVSGYSKIVELDVWSLVVAALDSGKRVFVPHVFATSDASHPWYQQMAMIEIASMDDVTSNFAPDKWGLRDVGDDEALHRTALLSSTSERVVPDLIVVPGVAFSPKGERCGRGKGYYDRFLARATPEERRAMLCVGVGFQCQLLDAVPTDATDAVLDVVVVPDKTIYVAETGGL